MGWWRRYLDWRRRDVREVVSDNVGFSVVYRGQRTRCAWLDIVRMVAFKRDLMTYDMLCVAIESDIGTVEVDENMPGYVEFQRDLAAALNLAPEWALPALFPAFALRPTLVFVRGTP